MTKPFEPTKEQEAVIGSDDAAMVVVASAGAGKTGTLVHRYLRLVQHERIKPDQILTITFTRKAAAEMKKRIVEALQLAGLPDEAQIAETGPIQTIHGFCERLLRENSVAAGLDPEFDVMSEGASARLVERCVRQALADSPSESVHAEALMSLLAGKTEERSPQGQLESVVRKALQELRGSGADFESLWRSCEDPDSVLFSWQRRVLETVPADVEQAFRRLPTGEDFPDRIRAAFKEVGSKAPKWAIKVQGSADRQAAEHACGLMALVGAAWISLDREMTRLQALDFSELERRAVSLVEDHAATGERLRAQYKVAMVDEAQDVNPMQYRLLRALRLRSEMLVGDHQQSIYGFRQADMELFRERARAIGPKHLSRNWRSDPGILAFVDEIFGQQWGEAYKPMREPVGDFDAEPASFEGVEVWKLRDSDSMAVASYVGELIADGTPIKEITVLVRGLPHGVRLQESLQLKGIKSRIVGGSEREKSVAPGR